MRQGTIKDKGSRIQGVEGRNKTEVKDNKKGSKELIKKGFKDSRIQG